MHDSQTQYAVSVRSLVKAAGVLLILLAGVILAILLFNHGTIGYVGGIGGLFFWYGVVAAILTMGALVLWAGIHRPRPSGRCSKCNYDLRGNPDDGCPECGWNR